MKFFHHIFFSAALVVLLAMPAHASSTYKIMIVGDDISSKAGGIPVMQRWLTGFKMLLDEAGADFEVVNLSRVGDTSRRAKSLMAAQLRDHKPNLVVVQVGAMDLRAGYTAQYTAENLTAMLTMAKATGAEPLLVGFDLPKELRRSQKNARLEAMYKRIAKKANSKVALVDVNRQARLMELGYRDIGFVVKLAQKPTLQAVWPLVKPMVPSTRDAIALAD